MARFSDFSYETQYTVCLLGTSFGEAVLRGEMEQSGVDAFTKMLDKLDTDAEVLEACNVELKRLGVSVPANIQPPAELSPEASRALARAYEIILAAGERAEREAATKKGKGVDNPRA